MRSEKKISSKWNTGRNLFLFQLSVPTMGKPLNEPVGPRSDTPVPTQINAAP